MEDAGPQVKYIPHVKQFINWYHLAIHYNCFMKLDLAYVHIYHTLHEYTKPQILVNIWDTTSTGLMIRNIVLGKSPGKYVIIQTHL